MRSIHLDFDGVIAKVVKEGFTDFGEVFRGIKEFTDLCATDGIKVYIWSARFDEPQRHEGVGYGTKCVEMVLKIKEYLDDHNIYYDDFYIHAKPWGAADHQSDIVIDDNVIEFTNAKYLIERFFKGPRERLAKDFYEKFKGVDGVSIEYITGQLSHKCPPEDREYVLMRILELRARDHT